METKNLLFAKESIINDKISIHIPTIKEIFDFGEQTYFGIVQNLISTPFDLMVELDDIGIDYETVTNYQLFILTFKSLAANFGSIPIIFGDLDLTDFIDAVNTENNERVLYSKSKDIVIDEMIALDISQALRKIHFFDAPIGQAGNKEAKQYMIERKRIKQRRLRNKPYKSFLESLIVPLVCTEEFKYDFETVQNLSIYQFNTCWKQIEKKKNWDNTMFGVYSGNVDAKSLNLEKLNWLSPE